MNQNLINSVIRQIFDQMDGDSYAFQATVKIGRAYYPVELFWHTNEYGHMIHIAQIMPHGEQGFNMTVRQWQMINEINDYMREHVDFIF